MPVFRYKARDNQGAALTATLEAENEMAVEASLRSMDYNVISIEPQARGLQLDLSEFFEKFKKSYQYELIYFSRQLASLLKAGIPISGALSSISEQTRNKILKNTVEVILRDIQEGVSFSDALSRHPQIFSEVFISMVRVGEASGMLDVVLDRVAELGSREYDIKMRVKSAMVYPVILVVVAIIVLSFLLINIIPRFVGIFEAYEMRLPLATRILLAVSWVARKFIWVVALVAAGSVVAFRRYARTEKGRYKLDSFLMRLPYFGRLYLKVIVSRFAQTLGMLIKSGVPLLESLYVTERTIGNTVVQHIIENIRSAITQGRPLAEPLKASGIFPATVVQMVALGEKSGQLDQMLIEVAGFYDREVEFTIKNITTALEPLLLLTMGLAVAFIALAVLLPIFNLVRVFRH